MSILVSNRPSYSIELTKLEELILCVAERTKVGITKLEKLLYFCDFEAARVLGSSISGDQYRNFQWGPVPKHFVPALEELIQQGKIHKEEIRLESGKKYVELTPKTHCDATKFTADENAIIDRILAEHGKRTAQELVALTHNELTWKLTTRNEEIPLFLCHYRYHKRPTEEAVNSLLADENYRRSIEAQLKTQAA